MPKDYAAEYEHKPWHTFDDLGWRAEPQSFGPRGGIYMWRLIVIATGEVIRTAYDASSLDDFVAGVRFERDRIKPFGSERFTRV